MSPLIFSHANCRSSSGVSVAAPFLGASRPATLSSLPTRFAQRFGFFLAQPVGIHDAKNHQPLHVGFDQAHGRKTASGFGAVFDGNRCFTKSCTK